MIQPILLFTAGLFFVVLYLRYRNRQKEGQPRKRRRRPFMLAKVILVALLAWLIVSYKLQSLLGKMGGENHEPSLVERVVSSISSHKASASP